MIISNICDSNMWLGGYMWPTKQSNTARCENERVPRAFIKMLITFGDEGKVAVQVDVKLKVRLNILSFFTNPDTAEKVSLLASR